uniref:Tantalus-like domain-containing protein n=1 Tax=Gasterosteus aculeatus aculeatus TaxID=481459 RepID=A0AAQ4Q3A9_GASAC
MNMIFPQTISVVNLHHLSSPFPPSLPAVQKMGSREAERVVAFKRSGRRPLRSRATERLRNHSDTIRPPPRDQGKPPTWCHRPSSKESKAAVHMRPRRRQSDQRGPETEVNVVERCAADATRPLDTMETLSMDTMETLSMDNASPPKGWVIGPLFQSFRSKMASFTEIVMTPVKLFRANSPPPFTDLPDKLDELELEAAGASDDERSQPSDACPPGAQDEGADPERLSDVQAARGAMTVALLYSKKLSFDEELPAHGSEQVGGCATTQKEKDLPDSVPLERLLPSSVPEEASDSGGSVNASILLQPSLNVSASREAKLEMSGAAEDRTCRWTVPLKQLSGKCLVKKVTSKTSTSKVKKEKSAVGDEQVTLVNSVQINKADSSCSAPPDTVRPQPDVCESRTIEDMDRPGNLRNSNDLANGVTTNPSLDPPLPDCELNPKSYSASCLGREKRGVQLDYLSKDLIKKRRQEPWNVASGVRILRPQRREVVSTTVVHQGETPKLVEISESVSTRANKKGSNGPERLATANETVLITESCSLDKSSGVSENNLKVSSSRPAPSGPCKKTRTGLSKPDVDIDNRMELEPSVAAASTKQAEQEKLSEAIMPLQSTSKRRNIGKKPVKRKSPSKFGLIAQSDGTLFTVSPAPSAGPLDLPPADLNVQKEESSEKGLTMPSKRTKKHFRVAASGGSRVTGIRDLRPIAKANQTDERKGKVSMHPVYFEMTPFESNTPPVPSSSRPNGSAQSNHAAKHAADGSEESAAAVSDELFPSDACSISVPGSSARGVNIKPRRADKKRRRCQVLHSSACEGGEVTNAAAVDAAAPAAASSHTQGKDLSRRLLRSYSCPEIPSLRLYDTPSPSALHSPHHGRLHAAQQHRAHHAHESLRRARRHTVCSVEVEREIAPLCLRKEVYPSRRSLPSAAATQLLGWSPSLSSGTSLAALASSFLSSPLAFLSKKASPGNTALASSSSSAASCSPVPRVFLFRMDSSTSAASDYSSRGNPLECEMERRQRSEEEDDGEDTSSSSQESEDVGLREEKALSDSEIRVGQKHEERGKVSSIKIRKTLPKPQNNLTPMGLPRPVRLKKKEFSLEEIYTNKNFSKPPESRLETIFEVPLSRRDGSESWYGQRRVKRFLEFLDAGEVRKPKKPLVGVGKAGVSSSRTRRGGFPKDEASLCARDVDSLLCAKLDQLTLLLIDDQKDS